MASSYDIEKIYTSRQWRQCRRSYLQKVGGLCENCLKTGIVKPAEEVHHRKPITPETMNNASIVYGFDNLVALCKDCHHAQHDPERKRWRADSKTGHVSLE